MTSIELNSVGPKVLWVTPNTRRAAGRPTSTVINGLIAESEGGSQPELATTRGLDLYASVASLTNTTRFAAQSIGADALPRVAAASEGAEEWRVAEQALVTASAGVLLILALSEAASPFLIELLFGSDLIYAVPVEGCSCLPEP